MRVVLSVICVNAGVFCLNVGFARDCACVYVCAARMCV